MPIEALPPNHILMLAASAAAAHEADFPPSVLGRLQAALATGDAAEVTVHGAQALYAHRGALTPALARLGAELAHQAATWGWYGFGKGAQAVAVRNALLRDAGDPDPSDAGPTADPEPAADYAPPPPADPVAALEAAKVRALTAVAARRWAAEQRAALPDGTVVPSDTAARGNVAAAVELMGATGALPTATWRWKLGRGDRVNMTRADLLGLGLAMADHVQACFAREESLELLIEAAPTPAAVAAINLDAGWP